MILKQHLVHHHCEMRSIIVIAIMLLAWGRTSCADFQGKFAGFGQPYLPRRLAGPVPAFPFNLQPNCISHMHRSNCAQGRVGVCTRVRCNLIQTIFFSDAYSTIRNFNLTRASQALICGLHSRHFAGRGLH